MPVPTWDCADLVLLDEQQSEGGETTTTVVSEDIWKKFDLDFPQTYSLSSDRYYSGIEDGLITDPYDTRSTSLSVYDKFLTASSTSRPVSEAREIRHHDCMWAGLCISKEHNRTHPAKKSGKDLTLGVGGSTTMMAKRSVPAGRSLLISRKQPNGGNCPQNLTPNTSGLLKNLESDGDSTRPETPQSCESESEDNEDEEEEEESEDEIPDFKHDSISINDKLSEYICGGEAVPISEVTGQLIVSRKMFNDKSKAKPGVVSQQRFGDSKFRGLINDATSDGANTFNNQRNGFNPKNESRGYANPSNNHNNCTSIVSLGDHCYHLNQTTSNSKKLEHLGVQTPSDSEEEIDVVTFDKPSFRPASLPTNPSLADKHHLQKTVTSALKDKSSVPRPRGRPPSNTPRKRSAQTDQKPAKRAKHKTSYQKRKTVNNSPNSSPTNNNNNSKSIERNDNSNSSIIGKNHHHRSVDNNCSRVQDQTESEMNATIRNEKSLVKFEKNERLESVGGSNNNNNNSNSNNNNSSNQSRGSKSGGSSIGQSSRSGSSDDEPETEKRSLHNNMERQRRIELRNAFEELRVLVPEVEMKEKAPKVVILRQAAVYCDMLTEIGQKTSNTVNELKRRQDRLRSRLSQLRRNFRSERRGAEVRNGSSNHQNHHHHHHHLHNEARRGVPALQDDWLLSVL